MKGMLPKKPLIIAHRGASFYHRENTVEAFAAALEMGARMVELDVRRTADGVLVAHHDPNIGDRLISDMTLADAGRAAADSGYRLATLEETVTVVSGKCALDVELKESGYEKQVVEATLDLVDPEDVLFTSSLDAVVGTISALEPGVRTGLIIGSRPRFRLLARLFPGRRLQKTGADVLIVSKKLLPYGFLRINRTLEVPIWVYTVNDRKELWKLITDHRIDGIFSDRPDVAMFLRDLYAVSRNTEDRKQKTEGKPGHRQGLKEES